MCLHAIRESSTGIGHSLKLVMAPIGKFAEKVSC